MQKNKNIRLTDIARMANVSVGTVDRVIHNRGRVSEENIRRVKEIMEQVGYKPNLIARSLAVKKPCHLVALIPDFRPGDYWSAMEYGIRRAEEEWESYGVKVSVLTFDQYSKASFDQAVSRLQEMPETVDGVIVGTLFKEAVIQLSEHLFFYIRLFSNCLDHQVCVGQRCAVGADRDQLLQLARGVRTQALLGDP